MFHLFAQSGRFPAKIEKARDPLWVSRLNTRRRIYGQADVSTRTKTGPKRVPKCSTANTSRSTGLRASTDARLSARVCRSRAEREEKRNTLLVRLLVLQVLPDGFQHASRIGALSVGGGSDGCRNRVLVCLGPKAADLDG